MNAQAVNEIATVCREVRLLRLQYPGRAFGEVFSKKVSPIIKAHGLTPDQFHEAAQEAWRITGDSGL